MSDRPVGDYPQSVSTSQTSSPRAKSNQPANIFGTDGIRDRGGRGWLAPEGLRRLAEAVARWGQRTNGPTPRVLIGRDSRTSGPEIEAILRQELERHGAAVRIGGILPTPAVSLLVAHGRADAGIVISASHNPPEDNGVKLFRSDGRKLTIAEEESISADVLAASGEATGETPPELSAETFVDEVLRAEYLDRLLASFGEGPFLDGLHVVIDCARGATSVCALEAFERAGARVEAIHAEPSGAEINRGCGSTHPEAIAGVVLARGADLGIAFDGDGDRAILVDARGETVDGDDMLTLWALDLQSRGELPNDRIAVTVMSNAGMERYLAEAGVSLARTPVGDREVHQTMLREGLALGGEQSGHLIVGEAATGDGIRTGLAMARLVHESGKPLHELRAPIPRYPQTLTRVEVASKPPLESIPAVMQIVAEGEAALADRGRILLRYSGTEPVARILVEGADEVENRDWAERIAAVLREQPELCV